MKIFDLPKMVSLKSGEEFNTDVLMPHVECYFIEDNKLYAESIDGYDIFIGEMSNG